MNSNYNQEIGSDHERIYYNCRIDNQIDNVSTSATTNAVYDVQSQNVLERQSDYEMAVSSYDLRVKMPLFIAPIIGGTNTDINAMPYSVSYSITVGGVTSSYKTDLIWQPDYAWISANPSRSRPLPRSPNANNGIQDLTTNPDYYYCKSYDDFLDMVNLALATSYASFVAVHGASYHSAPVFIKYDARTGLFAIVGELSYATGRGGIGLDKAFVGVDALLYKYFDGIRATFNGYNTTNATDYQFTFENKNGQSNAWAYGNQYAGAVPNPQTLLPTYVIMEQETEARFLWNNIKQIVITTDSINVRTEYMPFIEFPQQINKSSVNRFNQPRKSIISYEDYNNHIPHTSASIHRQINYEPLFYKWIDLVGDSVLNNIQLEIFFQTEEGITLPINIPKSSVCNIKLVFRKKN